MDKTLDPISQAARDLEAKLAPRIESARDALVTWDKRAVGFIRQNPTLCLAGAVALGFVIGKIASRR